MESYEVVDEIKFIAYIVALEIFEYEITSLVALR